MSQGFDFDDDSLSIYQPYYVECYISNRSDENQTIEDWTEMEGEHHFPASEIYAPVNVPVAISGSECNGYAINMTRNDWYEQFSQAVCESLVGGGLAKKGDKIELEDVRRDPIKGRSIQEVKKRAKQCLNFFKNKKNRLSKQELSTQPLEVFVPLIHKQAKLLVWVVPLKLHQHTPFQRIFILNNMLPICVDVLSLYVSTS